MNNPSLPDLEAFLQVANTLSFCVAARELGVAQSTVSRRVASLENSLGHRLVVRTTRKVELTNAGLRYAADLQEVMLRLQEAGSRLSNQSPAVEGTLRITMPTGFGRAYVLPRIALLTASHPRLRLELDLSDRYVDMAEGEYDIAVRMAPSDQTGIHCEKIQTFDLTLCASPNYLAKHGSLSDISDIANHICLAQRVYTAVKTFPVEWKSEKQTLAMKPRISVPDSTSLKALCLLGNGLAILPSYLIADELNKGDLVQVLDDLHFEQHSCYLMCMSHKKEWPGLQAVIQALRPE